MARALVTGAASGIGAGISDHLSSAGWDIVRSDRSGGSTILAHDVTDEAAWARIIIEHGPFEAVINSAGVRVRRSFIDVTLAEWNEVVGINLTGTFLGIREFARACITSARPGTFLAIGSVNSFSAVAGQPHYVASKAGIAMLVKAAALEFAPYSIRINALAPGPIDTPLLAERLATPEGRAWLESKVPLGRIGDVHDCAAAAEFLVSESASYITGITLPVDGGWLTQ